jgi:hypothetical protein
MITKIVRIVTTVQGTTGCDNEEIKAGLWQC